MAKIPSAALLCRVRFIREVALDKTRLLDFVGLTMMLHRSATEMIGGFVVTIAALLFSSCSGCGEKPHTPAPAPSATAAPTQATQPTSTSATTNTLLDKIRASGGTLDLNPKQRGIQEMDIEVRKIMKEEAPTR